MLVYTTTWMIIKNIMLNKISQPEKQAYGIIAFSKVQEQAKLTRDRNQRNDSLWMWVGLLERAQGKF